MWPLLLGFAGGVCGAVLVVHVHLWRQRRKFPMLRAKIREEVTNTFEALAADDDEESSVDRFRKIAGLNERAKGEP